MFGHGLPLAVVISVFGVLPQVEGVSAQDGESRSFVENFDTFDRSRWYVSDGWANAEWQNCTWSKQQLRLKDGVLTLAFEKRPYKEREYSCAEIQTHQRFDYGIYEARFRTDEGSGLNAAFFTYIGPVHKQPHDEVDFEVLTRDTSQVSLNTFVDGSPKNGAVVPVEGGTRQFNDYAFVWEEDRIRWYVNGQLVHTATDDLPSHPQKIYLSLWGSDTFVDWMGAFEDPGRQVTMEIDRVAFTELGEPCQFDGSVACNLE